MSDVSMFPDWLASRAASSPDRDALAVGNEVWSFEALDREATTCARRLAALGVSDGDRVASLLENGFMAALLPHAMLRLGATLVPLNVRLSPSEISWQLADVRPRLLVSDSLGLEKIDSGRGELPRITIATVGSIDAHNGRATTLESVEEAETTLRFAHPSDSVLAILYTSGTTGNPKGAMLTAGNFWWSAIGSALNLGIHPDDRWLACMPLFHVGGLSILLRAAIYGTSVVVHESFDANAINAAIDSQGITIVSVVPVMLQRMLDARDDAPYPPSLRCILVGGGPVPHVLLERCISAGVPVVQTYGLTEACSQVATLSVEDSPHRIGSAGKVLYPNEIRIHADGGGIVTPEVEGEILVRGPVVMAGYANLPDETARAIVDGWLHTGDMGRMDERGYLYVLDRRDDLIISGGENVYPAEVEAVLASHPSVAEVCVTGAADSEWGQRVIAVVRLTTTLDNSDLAASVLIEHCRTRLASYKVPREFRFVTDSLPRTASGKLRRAEVRKSLLEV